MVAPAKASGARLGRKLGSAPNNGGLSRYPVSNGYASNIFSGDLVRLVNGYVVRAAAADRAHGVFMGCYYIDSNGKFKHSSYFPSGTANLNSEVIEEGFTTPIALVADDPNNTYVMWHDSSVSIESGKVGLYFDLSASSGDQGSTVNGQSRMFITGAGATAAANLPLQMLGIYNVVDNDRNAASVAVEVRLNPQMYAASADADD